MKNLLLALSTVGIFGTSFYTISDIKSPQDRSAKAKDTASAVVHFAEPVSEISKLTICDFSKSSNTKRLWVIDTDKKEILFNSLVAHGMGTGEEFAEKFSNTDSSHQSSLGFYVTETTYNGNNGYSLRLLGMDKGFNDAALSRAIVMHGADYVSENFAKQHKRIGRSWGCPAVPRDLAEPIINTIKAQNVLFIYYPDEQYLASSEWLK